jgi:hypothetical protein
MRSTCKHCGKPLLHIRAGAQYHLKCRLPAWRKRKARPPSTIWLGHEPKLSSRPPRHGGLSNEELGQHLLVIAEERDDGEPKTGRRYYYLCLSCGHISPDMSATKAGKKSRDAAYNRVLKVLGVLRKQGELEWEMVLDLTRELTQWEIFSSPREARESMRMSYTEDKWIGQPFYPIQIVEKDTMVPVCEPMAEKWQMPFASSRGYSSLTLQHDIAKALKRRLQQHPKQKIIVYFISDLDPSGLDLERKWKEVLEEFGIYFDNGNRWHRLALTFDQVTNPELDIRRLSIEVKKSDSRSKGYIEQYGKRCREVDILPADEIENALDSHIFSWLKGEQWKRRKAEIERARELL